MHPTENTPPIDWDSPRTAELDAKFRYRLAYRRKDWKRTSTKYLYFESFREVWEFREKLLANEFGLSPIVFVKLDFLDRPRPPRSRTRRPRRRTARPSRPRVGGGQ